MSQVWTKFTKQCNGKELKFRIQEVPKELNGEVFNLFFDYFVPEEPIHVAAKLTKSEAALKEYKEAMNKLTGELAYQIDVCCLDDDSDNLKIIAASVMSLEKKGDTSVSDEELKFGNMCQTPEMNTLFKLASIMSEAYKVIEKHNLDTYYDDKGIVVHPDYRGFGIAGELLKARVVTCKARGVPMTGAWMTSIGSQIAGAKLGWETVCELQYKDLEEKGGVTFEGTPLSLKLMVIKL